MLSRGKIVVIAISIGIVASLGALYLYSQGEAGQYGSQVRVTLKDVKMKSLDEQNNVMNIEVDFNVLNNADKTLTISKMDYELFANENSVGRGFFSAEDIAMTGRPGLFSHANATIVSDFQLKYSDTVKDLWGSLKNKETNNISWRVNGTAEIESAISIAEVPFDSKLG